METKVDFDNLEKENIMNIADRLGDLAEDSGDVFLWTSDSVSVTKPERFSSKENAKEYGILKNEFYIRRGMIKRNEPISYIIGSEKEHQKAVKSWLRRKIRIFANVTASLLVAGMTRKAVATITMQP